ncbi:MAG: maleylpyruvate isomerase family mycothiol-dependent enzyme [Actinomycetes bacterium]
MSTPSNPALRMSGADIPTLIGAWVSAARDFHDFVKTLDADQWQTMSPCPGWTVADLTAHIVGIERDFVGDELPPHEPDWAGLTHVRDDDFSRWTEGPVDQRRSHEQADVIAELADVIERRIVQLADMAAEPESMVDGPRGKPVTLERALRMRTFDTWVHEQDARTALDQPGHLDSPGAHLTADFLVASLPFVLGKAMGATTGTTLHIVVEGAIPFERMVRIGEDGRASFVEVQSAPLDDLGESWARISTDWPTFVALATGRVDASSPIIASAVSIDGDHGLAHRYLAHANVTP